MLETGERLKVLDLFSGIGMFSYGLEKTGYYQTVAFCENDGPCRDVLYKHWPDIEVFGDVRFLEYQRGCLFETLDDLTLHKVFTVPDVIVGGFPCQDISNSGPKTGLDGDRSGLWEQYRRLISEIKPKGVIIENSSALKHRGLVRILKDLATLGYDAEWHSITASHFGAVHKRDRLWIIAYPSSIGPQGSWKPLEPCDSTATRNREAGIIEYALQENTVPYLCGDHDGSAGRVDRLKQLGNTVYWPIVEHLGKHLYDNITRGSI